jgi:REP element-mobilizing transposase RayT
VPKGLKRYYQRRHLHFITFSCYRRLPLLASPRRRDALLRLIELVHNQHRCPILGYVLMPEHVHLLIAPPENGDPSTFIQAIKQRSSRQFHRPSRRKLVSQEQLFKTAQHAFWQKRSISMSIAITNGWKSSDTSTTTR